MGLDVSVNLVVMPDEILDTVRKVGDFCERRGCTFYDADNCPAIRETPFLVTVPREYYVFEDTLRNKGLDPEDYRFYGERGSLLLFEHRVSGDDLQIDGFEDPAVVTRIEPTEGFFLSDREIGSHSKGANRRFYEDGKWTTDTVVVDRKTLLEHWKKYFSDKDDPYYGKDAGRRFKESIVDNFVEGRHIVCYW